MTIVLKNADSNTLEAIKNLQKMQKKLEIEILDNEIEFVDKESFESLSAFMQQDLQKGQNLAVFERLKDK